MRIFLYVALPTIQFHKVKFGAWCYGLSDIQNKVLLKKEMYSSYE